MILESFRILRFRCLEDSGIVHMANDITVLAGKNESGKTAILEALELFLRPEKATLSHHDRTLGSSEPPHLIAVFLLEDSEVIKIQESYGVTVKDRRIEFDLEAGTWTISGPAYDEIVNYMTSTIETQKRSVLVEVQQLDIESDADLSSFDEVKRMVEQDLTSSEGEPLITEEIRNGVNLVASLEMALEGVDEFLKGFVPPVVLFRSFEDEIPDSAEISDPSQANKPIVKSFCRLAELDLTKLSDANADPHERNYITERATEIYSSKFSSSGRGNCCRDRVAGLTIWEWLNVSISSRI